MLKKYELEQAKLESEYVKNKQKMEEKARKEELAEKVKESPIDTFDIVFPEARQDSFHITYILPLQLDPVYDEEFDQTNISKAAQEFYSGMQLAFRDSMLDTLNSVFEVMVLDNRGEANYTQKEIILKLDSVKTDLIIGPFTAPTVSLICDYSHIQKIPMFSPFVNVDSCIERNPYFITVRPSENQYTFQVVNFIKTYFDSFHIVWVFKDQESMDNTMKIINERVDTSIFASFNTSILNFMNWNKAAYMKHMQEEKTVFVFPIENEVIINSIITNLIKKENEFDIIIPFSWLNYNSVDISYLQKLNPHLVSEFLMDYNDSFNRPFIEKYRDQYKTEPSLYAYKGFSITLYSIQLMNQYGRYFMKEAFIRTPEQRMPCMMYKQCEGNQGFENTVIKIYSMHEFALKQGDPMKFRNSKEEEEK